MTELLEISRIRISRRKVLSPMIKDTNRKECRKRGEKGCTVSQFSIVQYCSQSDHEPVLQHFDVNKLPSGSPVLSSNKSSGIIF